MRLAVDLHSHSGYAGGVGDISLADVSATMKLKGIEVFGTGDCLLPARMQELQAQLHETADGIYSLAGDTGSFVLQTEVILSTRLSGYRNKTIAHHIILFPSFKAIEKMQAWMDKKGYKNTIGRPFIVTNSQREIEDCLFEIQAIDKQIEIIPAHVATPDGILGSKNMLTSIREFYGEFPIHAIETGLSADPQMLEKIPDIANLTMISNSDCHSAALNRIGREFTVLDCADKSYSAIIDALRTNKVILTAEFNPAEGRYYDTGHRADRQGHSTCYHRSEFLSDNLCPVCHKPMMLGVAQRCVQLSNSQIVPQKRDFLHLIPLIEVVAYTYGLKSVTSKKVTQTFYEIMQKFDSEINLWLTKSTIIEKKLVGIVNDNVIRAIIAVAAGKFSFDPPGFDGNYGILKIGAPYESI